MTILKLLMFIFLDSAINTENVLGPLTPIQMNEDDHDEATKMNDDNQVDTNTITVTLKDSESVTEDTEL